MSDPLHELIARQRAQREDDPAWLAKRHLAASLRRLMDVLMATAAPPDEVHALAEEVADAARRFGESAPADSPATAAVGAGASGMEDFHDRSPLTGVANAMAPPAVLEHDDEKRVVRGRVTFGNAFEGGPGLVHGGFLASLLDEALGMATIYSGNPGMTGELTVRYHRATPIGVPLRIEARFDERAGRRIQMSGELYLGDEVCVSAKGTFIAVVYEKFREFHAERVERSSGGAE